MLVYILLSNKTKQNKLEWNFTSSLIMRGKYTGELAFQMLLFQ